MEENYIKKREQALKMHPAANLFVGEKKLSLKRGEGEMIEMHNIYPCLYI